MRIIFEREYVSKVQTYSDISCVPDGEVEDCEVMNILVTAENLEEAKRKYYATILEEAGAMGALSLVPKFEDIKWNSHS